MTLLTVTQAVCATVGVSVPASVFSGISTNRTMTEMLENANEMAQSIAYDTRDWQALKAVFTLTGNGTQTAFNLPADYKRMLLTANLWRSSNHVTPSRFISDTDDWLRRRAMAVYDGYGEWTILGNQLLTVPALASGVTAYIPYLHKNCVALTSGGFGSSFQADTDSFALDERVLKLGMIWHWKAQKGSPYQEDLGTYGDALSYVMGHDGPSAILIGRKNISSGARTAYPFPVPTP